MPEPCADCRTPVPVGYNRCLPCTRDMLANLPTFTMPTIDACRELTSKHEAFKWAEIERRQREQERWKEPVSKTVRGVEEPNARTNTLPLSNPAFPLYSNPPSPITVRAACDTPADRL